MSPLRHPATPDPATAVAALRRILPEIAARAPGLDHDGAFPAEDLAALHAAGLLRAPLPTAAGGFGPPGAGGFGPPGAGGLGLGTEPAGAAALATVLRLIGRASLPLGRLYEGHVNALRLILRHGDPGQRAAAARDVLAGHLFAVWNTDAPDGTALRLHPEPGGGLRLTGRKILCSGAGCVPRALVTARAEAAGPPQLLLVPLPPGQRADLATWTAQGMRASASGAVDLTDLVLPEAARLGRPGAYEQQPDFSAGAWRFAAVQTGGIEALAEALRDHLRRTSRHADPHQAARLGQVAIATETARLWVEAAALRAEAADPGDAAAYVNLARTAVERAALDVLELAQRSIGLTAFLRPNPAERLARDLATYLRQPGPDRALVLAAAHVAEAANHTGDLWA